MMAFLRQHRVSAGALAVFAVLVGVSFVAGFTAGQQIGRNFLSFLVDMVRILPCVFILIGLFDVWVKRETVERHLGPGAGALSYLWAVLLAGTAVGGMHVAFPVAYALQTKGARLGVVIAYLSAAAICRVPMTLFEASFLGWKFTAVRFAVSLPLLVVASALIGRAFERRGYALPAIETSAVQPKR